jgi:alkanesulfonate monooxygenase SsuD/methylene tetrahydromethanopterin reductase-like flavin-dependent oxidoreductase (luciferase family)
MGRCFRFRFRMTMVWMIGCSRTWASLVASVRTAKWTPVFVATSGSPQSAKYAAARGFISLYFTPLATSLTLGNAYQDTAVESGRKIKLGQNQAIVRITHIADSKAAAEQAFARCDSDIFRNFYTALAGRELAPAKVLGAVSKCGLWAFGTADDEQWKQFPVGTLSRHWTRSRNRSRIGSRARSRINWCLCWCERVLPSSLKYPDVHIITNSHVAA